MLAEIFLKFPEAVWASLSVGKFGWQREVTYFSVLPVSTLKDSASDYHRCWSRIAMSNRNTMGVTYAT